MGRNSKLTEKQWGEIEQRLLNGEKGRALAREFGIAEATIRERFSAHHRKIKDVANQIVNADAALKALPISAQISAQNLAAKLMRVSEHMCGAAEYTAASAHRLSMLANQQLQKVDDVDPMKSLNELQAVATLTKLANSSSEIGINLLRANKEEIERINKQVGAEKGDLLKEIAQLLPD